VTDSIHGKWAAGDFRQLGFFPENWNSVDFWYKPQTGEIPSAIFLGIFWL